MAVWFQISINGTVFHASSYAVAYLGEFEEDAISFLETAGGTVTVRLETDTAEGR